MNLNFILLYDICLYDDLSIQDLWFFLTLCLLYRIGWPKSANVHWAQHGWVINSRCEDASMSIQWCELGLSRMLVVNKLQLWRTISLNNLLLIAKHLWNLLTFGRKPRIKFDLSNARCIIRLYLRSLHNRDDSRIFTSNRPDLKRNIKCRLYLQSHLLLIAWIRFRKYNLLLLTWRVYCQLSFNHNVGIPKLKVLVIFWPHTHKECAIVLTELLSVHICINRKWNLECFLWFNH